jgi:hypothetical protein
MKFIKIHGVTEIQEQDASTSLASCATTNRTLYSEQVKSREAKPEQKRDKSSSDEPDPVGLVFGHWQQIWKKPRSKLDPKRRAVILKALKSYDVATLCESISGYRESAFHLGANDRNKVFDDIELFLRDAAHIDQGLGYTGTNGSGPPKPRAPKSIAELEAEEAARDAQH